MAAATFDLTFNGYWREAKISGLPAQSGVYCAFLCSYQAQDKAVVVLRLLYIGETGNANTAVAHHPLWPKWKAMIDQPGHQICFNFAPVSSVRRRQVAAALIYAHQPVCNEEFKTNFPFEATTVTLTGRVRVLQKKVSVAPAIAEE